MSTSSSSSDKPKAEDAKSQLSEEQQRHHDELYTYKKDAEGTLDTSDILDAATNGVPNTPTAGPDADSESTSDELLIPGFNNPINDNNR